VALDHSQHMLETALKVEDDGGGGSGGSGGAWSALVADFRHIPLRCHVGDLAIAAWSLSYLKVHYGDTWRDELHKVLKEIKRIIRPGGTVVVIETLGTAVDAPRRTGSQYYKHLSHLGFQFTWIRTDYLFDSVQEAEQQMRFFFGKVVANTVLKEGMRMVPECTGIWWSSVDDIPV